MSLNLNSVVLTQAYDAVRNGTSKWVLYTLTASNDLKIEEVGDSTATLRDLADEFSDGKIQFAFAGVVDSNSKLQKFVLINWCGGGVPVARKSRFHTYANDIARVFTGAHVVIQAREESDVEPDVIRKKVAESGGSKYTTSGNAASSQPARMERPAPVGSNYTPIGRPDIASMTSGNKPDEPSQVGSTWKPKHNELQDIRKAGNASSTNAEEEKVDTVVGTTWQPKHNELQEIRAKAARDRPEAPGAVGTTWQPKHNELQEIRAKAAAESQKSREASHIPPASLPPAVSRPIPSPSLAQENSKPSYERPEPVGTSYTPVSIPKAGKLGDRLAAFQQQPSGSDSAHSVSSTQTGGKKLTWSERQAQAKKQQEGEEAASSAAIAKAAGPATPAAPAAPSAPAPPPAPPAPTPPSNVSTPAAPPAPAAPPMPPMPPRAPSAVAPTNTIDDEWDADDKSGSEDDMGPVRAPPFVNMGARPTSSIPQAPPPPPAPGAQAGAAAADVMADKEKDDQDREAEEQAERLDKLKLAEEEAHEAAAIPRPRGESAASSTKKAKVLYDYQAEEGNELDLAEGEIVTDIEQIDDGWWSGTVDGRTGLFPANYVELVEAEESSEPPREASPPPAVSAPLAPPAPPMPSRPTGQAQTSGPRARALYDYVADEDNEITFNEGDEIAEIEFDSDDWWSGSINGKRGLFPSNYVEMVEE